MEHFRTILLVDDDDAFVRAFVRTGGGERRVATVSNPSSALEAAKVLRPDLAIVDLRLGQASGLTLIKALREEHPGLTTVLVSAYLSVAFAVAAMRAGVSAILFKPVTLSEVLHHVESDDLPDAPATWDETPSLARAEWEHITRDLIDCDGNVSAAARRLGIYRQSLQRKLRKHAPRG